MASGQLTWISREKKNKEMECGLLDRYLILIVRWSLISSHLIPWKVFGTLLQLSSNSSSLLLLVCLSQGQAFTWEWDSLDRFSSSVRSKNLSLCDFVSAFIISVLF